MEPNKISRAKFASIIAYIAGGTQQTLTDAGMEVYYDLLGDLPYEALMIAAKRAVLEHNYATFPPVAILRQFATETKKGEVTRLTGSDAWGMAMKAIARCDAESDGSIERAFVNVPEIVRVAVYSFGFRALYNLPDNGMETARAQFVKLFESIAERERKTGLLPAVVQEQIAAIGGNKSEALPSPVLKALEAIGGEK